VDGTDRSSDDLDAVDRVRPDGHLRAVPDAPADAVPDGAAPAEARDQDGGVRQAAEAFAAELIRLRTAAELSQSVLARRLGYTKSYVTHLERCTQAPTKPVARQADRVLGSGETLTRLWHAYRTARAASRRQPHHVLPAADAQEGPGHDADGHACASPEAEVDSSGQPGVPPGIDMRGATNTNVNVQIGNGNTQHVTF